MAKKKKDSKGTGFAAKMRNTGATSKKKGLYAKAKDIPKEVKIWLIVGFSLFVLFLIAYSTCATAWENAPPLQGTDYSRGEEEDSRFGWNCCIGILAIIGFFGVLKWFQLRQYVAYRLSSGGFSVGKEILSPAGYAIADTISETVLDVDLDDYDVQIPVPKIAKDALMLNDYDSLEDPIIKALKLDDDVLYEHRQKPRPGYELVGKDEDTDGQKTITEYQEEHTGKWFVKSKLTKAGYTEEDLEEMHHREIRKKSKKR